MIPPRKGKPWPWNTIREPRPADWGFGMTVCIAAHNYKSPAGESIICVTDAMVSTGDMSADASARKIQFVANGWNAMFAGNDMSYLAPITRSVGTYLANSEQVNVDTVSAAFVAAYKTQLVLRAETEVLGTLGYTLEDFKLKGLKQLGSETFSRLLYEIQQQTIELTFLIAGFDGHEPHIFTVSSPGKVEHYSELGFWAIGSGQTHALGSLFNLARRVRFLSRSAALYRLCEAKFNAENALGVGQSTSVSLMEPNMVQRMLFGANELRPIWEATRSIYEPPDAKETAKKILKPEPIEEPLLSDSSQLEKS